MEPLAFAFFPFPYVSGGARHEGLQFKWPARCQSCDRQCESAKEGQLRLCSYGVNYWRFGRDFLVAGIVVRDFPQSTPARRKMLHQAGRGPSVREVHEARRAFDEVDAAGAQEIRDRKDAIIAAYQASAEYKREVLDMLKPHLRQMLAQIHDYRQFVSTVVQNMNVIVEKRDPSPLPIEDKLAKASHEEVAIYWAARLLEERLQAALFLLEPERLDDHRNDVAFRFHGCVLKYLRIYQRAFDQRHVKIEVSGESYANVVGNPAAAGVIPHTLIDNALKYSPNGSLVRIQFHETGSDIGFMVGSFGPRITKAEEPRIFDLFFRGKEAARLEPEGTGFGLYLAQFIANHFNARIRVVQDTTRQHSGRYWTEFSVDLPQSGTTWRPNQRMEPTRRQ